MPVKTSAPGRRRFLCAALGLAAVVTAGAALLEVKPLPDDPACTAADRAFMHRAHELAAAAVAHGNTAYGALLVKDGKLLMEFENDAITTRDVTHHAETGIISAASVKFGPAALAGCTLYASTEPCLMCCGAIRTAGITKLVYGVTGLQSHRLRSRVEPANPLQCREIFQRIGAANITVLGPLFEGEGLAIHAAAAAATAKAASPR